VGKENLEVEKAEGGKYQELASKVKTEKKIAGLLLAAGVNGFLSAHSGLTSRRR
jgi:hypothetical protein